MPSEVQKWFRLTLLNLLIVAFIGVLLRYKIAFSLPFLDQKFLLHGHSHFAFAGWITQALMTLMVAYLFANGQAEAFKKYKTLLIFNLITAYGMLCSFPVQGYGFFSITFSMLSIFVSYTFAIEFWQDLKKISEKKVSILWFKAALVFSVFSSIGPFSLSYMMATHNLHEKWYLSSVYFFLHFQYNGWFFFACMGLLMHKLEEFGVRSKALNRVFWYFFFACIPAYFLSVLWIPIHLSIYMLVVISSIIQLIGWFIFLNTIKPYRETLMSGINRTGRILILLAGVALTIKLFLQIGSTHPQLSQIAFGFRPIVIGYLHLVLLGMISLYIIGYAVAQKIISIGKTALVGLIIFVSGVIFNEVVLMIQGVEAMEGESVDSIHNYLFAIAIMMFGGIFILVRSQFLKMNPDSYRD